MQGATDIRTGLWMTGEIDQCVTMGLESATPNGIVSERSRSRYKALAVPSERMPSRYLWWQAVPTERP